MTKKQFIILLIAGLSVATVYYFIFRDSSGRPDIQISHTVRPSGWAMIHRRQDAATESLPRMVIFSLQGSYKLTEVKVVSVAELATNSHALPVWHLVSDSNSPPTQSFYYGERIRGMRQAIKGSAIEPLGSNITYRLFVDAGRLKATHDFTLGPEHSQ